MLIALPSIVFAQTGKDTLNRIIIENANNQVTDATTDTVVKYFNGDVRAYHKGNFIFCDSAKMVGNDLIAWGNVSIIQHDTTRLFADNMKYFGDIEKAKLDGSVILESGKNKLYTSDLDYDLKTKKGTYTNNAQLQNADQILKSKRGIYDVGTDKAYFYEKVSIDGKDFSMITDSMEYETENEIARWKTPALIISNKSRIYSEQGFYNFKDKSSEFIGNAQFEEDDKISNADTIRYNDITKEILLSGYANFASDSTIASADKIYYNKEKESIKLLGSAYYEDKASKAEGENIYYDKEKEAFSFEGGGKIYDGETTLSGLNLDYDKKSGKGRAVGNVIWQDTKAKTSIMCDSLDIRSKESYFKAINFKGKPLFTIELDGDTLFMSADTLKSFRRFVFRDSLRNVIPQITTTVSTKDSIKTPTIDSLHIASKIISPKVFFIDTIKYMVGDNHVELYKSDMQGVCDSITYNGLDSVFSLVQKPVIWTDTTQLYSDSIKIFLKERKIDRMNMKDNALVLTSPDLIYFNQIGGNVINSQFMEGRLKNMKVNGNARAIYYMLDDDKAYIGVNQTDASFMVFDFEEKKIRHIRSYTDPKSEMKPIKGTDHEALKLKGFEWKIALRPLSIVDLMQ